ncbi:MAG: glycosyltransferase family 4 protein [Agriterribacter sp.]
MLQKNSRLVFCADSPGPAYGGAEISLCRTVDYLKSNYDIEFVIHPQAVKEVKAFVREPNFSVHYHTVPNNSTYFLTGLFKAYQLTRKVRGIYIIWCHHLDSNRWLQLWLALSKKKFILAERLIPTSIDQISKSRLTTLIKKFVVKRSFKTVLCGYSQVDNYKAFFNADNCMVIPNSRPIAKIEEEARLFKSANQEKSNARIIVCVGRLSPQKDQLTLLKAIKIVSKKIDVKLMLVGEGESERELKVFVETNGLQNIFFNGFEKAPVKFLSQSDLFVLPSLSEGLPGAIIEAMAAKVPVIATDIPGNRELVIDGYTGLLVPVKDEITLAAAIEKMLTNPVLASTLSTNGFRHVLEHYSMDQEKEKWKALVESVQTKA